MSVNGKNSGHDEKSRSVMAMYMIGFIVFVFISLVLLVVYEDKLVKHVPASQPQQTNVVTPGIDNTQPVQPAVPVQNEVVPQSVSQ